jgi:hypothetical protein
MTHSALTARISAFVSALLMMLGSTFAAADTEPSGPMATARYRHVSAPLDGGRALVAGGFFENSGLATATAEIYNPDTNTFTATGSLGTARVYAGAATLMDWRVLVVGGATANQSPPAPLATAEIFDPAAGTWTATGTMNAARQSPVALRLASGLVLVIGGDSTQSTCELFDPATGLFTPTGSLLGPRVDFAASALDDGRVLVVGGQPSTDLPALASAEIWDPSTGTWAATGSMATARSRTTATKLSNGKVLVVAGMTGTSASSATASAELFDPATGSFTPAGSLANARSDHTAAASVFDGSVIVAGGTLATFFPTASIERYSPTGAWGERGSMVTARALHGAVSLNNGHVLIAGGYMQGVLASAEVANWQCVANNATISPTNLSYAYGGGTSNVSVSHTAGCSWHVTNVPFWITVNSGATGVGNGTVNFTVGSNSTSTDGRVATMNIGGAALWVGQGGNACATATIAPSIQSFSTSGGSFSVALSAPSSCTWTVAAAPTPWISVAPINGSFSGSGSANFTITVASNSAAARGANISIATKSVAVSQAGSACVPAPTISPSSQAFTGNGGSATVSVTAPSSCPWTVTGKPTWVTMASSGTGSGTLALTAAANAGAARSAIFTVAGNSFSVTQDAGQCAGATLAPTSASHSRNAETGSIAVNAPGACTWTVSGVPAWMTVTSGASGTGSGSVSYSVAANGGAARSATLGIAGATFSVSQAAAAATYCAARGSSSSYEWIQQVSIAGQSRSTGNNGGYADLTTTTPAISLGRAFNSIALSPGFSSGAYSETWRIWIDFNGDSTFSDSEIVYTGTASGPIGSSFTIPTSAPGGTTRMRIAMKWGGAPVACGTFSYGEVEDYTVTY